VTQTCLRYVVAVGLVELGGAVNPMLRVVFDDVLLHDAPDEHLSEVGQVDHVVQGALHSVSWRGGCVNPWALQVTHLGWLPWFVEQVTNL
jgi:hypothetical protein